MGEGFYEFTDAYAHEQRLIANNRDRIESPPDISPSEYYSEQALGLYRDRLGPGHEEHRPRMFNQALTMLHWHLHGRPYCKVFPGMAHMLAKTRLTVPAEFFKLPFPAFEIRFSVGNPVRESPESPPLRSVLLSNVFCSAPHPTKRGEIVPEVADTTQALFLMDFDETKRDEKLSKQFGTEVSLRLYTFLKLDFREGETMHDSFNRALELAVETSLDSFGYTPSIEFRKAVLSICVATSFFMRDEHQFICPDIPARYKDRYARAKNLPEDQREREMKAIAEQSKKLGNYGWTVGREVELPRQFRPNAYHSGGEGVKHGELKYQHLRDVHQRWQKIGPRDNPDVKLLWIMPTIVRPDLPVSPTARGYKITDKVLQTIRKESKAN